MYVVVVDASVSRLRHHGLRSIECLGRFAARERPLREKRLDDLAHENPLDPRFAVFDQCFDEEPLALDIKSEPPNVRLVACEPVSTKVEESATVARRAIERANVKKNARVEAAPW